MKKTLFSLFVGILTLSLNAQIENGDFENWNQIILYEHPYIDQPTSSSNHDTYIATQKANVTRISQNENSYMRIENINGPDDQVMPGYFLFGEPPVDGSIFNAGLLINDTQLSGISMDLKYNMFGSTGIVVVQFGNGDHPIGPGNVATGTYLFPITGEQDWTNVEFLFDQPIDPATKTCVIGIASADMYYDDNPYKLGAFIEVDNISFINSTDEFPNGGFDTWVPNKTSIIPQNTIANIHPDYLLINQSNKAYTGQYAVELNTVVEENGKTHIGSMIMAQKESSTGALQPTIQITNDQVLSFMYQYTATTDQASAIIEFYDNDQPVHRHKITLHPTDEYEKMEIPLAEIISNNALMATHITVAFYSSENSEENPAQSGSQLIIDDITLETAVGIMAMVVQIKTPTIHASPNPTFARVIFDFPKSLYGYYQVFNQNGTLLSTKNFSGKQTLHNLLEYPSGFYLFKFYHNEGFQAIKVIKY